MTLALAAACSEPPRTGRSAPATASSWIATPQVERVDRRGNGLMLSGLAAPDGRVVVRGPGGIAFATSADEAGRFSLRIDALTEAALLVVETQAGQDAIPAPYRLLVIPGADGPIALLTPGRPSVRLDPAGALDAVDSDGRTTVASGRSAPGAVMPIATAAESVEVRARNDGRWSLSVVPNTAEVTVGGRRFALPALQVTEGQTLAVTPEPGGLLVRWGTPDGAVQTSWFPDGE